MTDTPTTTPSPQGSARITQQPAALPPKDPLSQQKENKRPKWWPEWAQQLPYFRLPEAKQDFSLIDRVEMLKRLEESGTPQAVIDLIVRDLDHLDRELMPLFAERDREASRQQNRYRLYQLGFIVLATTATILGSLLALTVTSTSAQQWVPVFSFLETVVALSATYLAQITGREPPLPAWLTNRRRAESLRREYFRYLMDLPPYTDKEGYVRRQLLSERAALINQGRDPDQRPQTSDTGPTGTLPAPTSTGPTPTPSNPKPNGG